MQMRLRMCISTCLQEMLRQSCGKLNESVHGTLDAAQAWMDAYVTTMEDIGFKVGIAATCTFWHALREIRALVHGDDFTPPGHSEQFDRFKAEVAKIIYLDSDLEEEQDQQSTTRRK